MQCLQEFNLDDTEFVAGLVAIFGLEEVELAGCRLYHLYNLSEGIAVLGCTLQTDGDFVGQDGVLDVQVDVAEALFCVAFPDELLTGKDFQWVAALAPSGELHADVVHRGTTVELVGNPSCIELAIVADVGAAVVAVLNSLRAAKKEKI